MAKFLFGYAILSASLTSFACGAEPERPASPPPPPVEQTPTPEPAPSPPPPVVRDVTVTGIMVDPTIANTCGIQPPKAFFEYDAAKVQPSDQDTLKAVATCLSSGPLKGKAVRVVGHTDPRGADEYNQKLGQSRADSVADYLSKQGLERAKINADSRGEETATGTDEWGWARDRRVDIRLVK